MTYDEEQEIIEREFILAIENDRQWHDATRQHVARGQYNDYATICHDYTDRILCNTGMKTTSSTSKRSDSCMLNVRTRVALQLWESEGVSDSRVVHVHILTSHRELIREISRMDSKRPDPQPVQPESEIIMNTTTPAFQTKHYVFGQDVSAMSTSQLIDAIKRVEKEIADLSAVGTKSAKIGTMIEDLNSMLVKIVEVLDAQK